jgi:hypothetical protein
MDADDSSRTPSGIQSVVRVVSRRLADGRDWLLWVIRYRSLRDENRSMSAMPRKRRRAVKMSPVATGQMQAIAGPFQANLRRL